MSTTKGLKVGSEIKHKGNCYETFNKTFKATIIGFEGLAIRVKSDCGNHAYLINTWDLV